MYYIDIIFHRDVLATLDKMESECVDMIFADPPFNIGKKYSGYKDRRIDYFEWCGEWISECWRILKPTGSFYLMTLDRNLSKTFPLMDKYGIFLNLIKWKNVTGDHAKTSYWNCTQPILFYAKTNDYIFNTYAETRQGVVPWNPKRKENQRGQLLDYWDDISPIYAGSIVHPEAILKPGTREKAHLAQMPEKLVGRPIIFSTDPGQIVYDPFMGSGTTAIAALKLNRLYCGSDSSHEYCTLANNRIEKFLKTDLFNQCQETKKS